MASAGLETTFRFLAETENEASVDVLIAAFDCPHEPTRHHALRAILERRSPEGHREVFRRLPKMDESCRAIIDEHPDRLIRVVSHALRKANRRQCETACDAVVSFRLYYALPALVSVLVDVEGAPTKLLADAALKLSEKFYGELSGVVEGHTRKNQDAIRHRITSSLEDATKKFHRHKRTEVVEAFLLVAKPKNVALRQLLQRPDESSCQTILTLLAGSPQGGVIRLLLGFLEDPQMPRAVIKVIAERDDQKFIEHLLHTIGARPSKTVARSLKRFDSFLWAKPDNPLFDKLDDAAQHGAVQLLAASNMDREELLQFLGFVLTHGKPGGRRAAAEALAEFHGSEADAMAVRIIADEDAQVRAALIPQLRAREIPNALSLLIRMVDTDDEHIHEALRKAMPEFSYRQFMDNFDSMPDQLQAIGGNVVRKIDPEVSAKLAADMNSPSPVCRRRAVQAAGAMGAAQDMESVIIGQISDDDHMVRTAAAQILAECNTKPSWEALRDALFDSSVAVQEVAENSLRSISQSLMVHHEDADGEGEAENDGERQLERVAAT